MLSCTLHACIHTIGFLASLLLYSTDEQQVFRKIVADVTPQEIHFMKLFGIDDGDGRITNKEYVILIVVRLGAVRPEVISLLHQRFRELDRKGLGSIGYDELMFTGLKMSTRERFQRAVRKVFTLTTLAQSEEHPGDVAVTDEENGILRTDEGTHMPCITGDTCTTDDAVITSNKEDISIHLSMRSTQRRSYTFESGSTSGEAYNTPTHGLGSPGRLARCVGQRTSPPMTSAETTSTENGVCSDTVDSVGELSTGKLQSPGHRQGALYFTFPENEIGRATTRGDYDGEGGTLERGRFYQVEGNETSACSGHPDNSSDDGRSDKDGNSVDSDGVYTFHEDRTEVRYDSCISVIQKPEGPSNAPVNGTQRLQLPRPSHQSTKRVTIERLASIESIPSGSDGEFSDWSKTPVLVSEEHESDDAYGTISARPRYAQKGGKVPFICDNDAEQKKSAEDGPLSHQPPSTWNTYTHHSGPVDAMSSQPLHSSTRETNDCNNSDDNRQNQIANTRLSVYDVTVSAVRQRRLSIAFREKHVAHIRGWNIRSLLRGQFFHRSHASVISGSMDHIEEKWSVVTGCLTMCVGVLHAVLYDHYVQAMLAW